MKCPYCDTDMTAGTVQVRSSWASSLFWGLQFQHLRFKDGDRSRVVLEPGDERAAFCCPSCKATLLEGESRRKDEAPGPDPWGEEAGR